MGLKHIMPEKYYTIPRLWDTAEDEFFAFGHLKMRLAILNGYNGVQCPHFRKNGGKTNAWYVKGADFLKFKEDVEKTFAERINAP